MQVHLNLILLLDSYTNECIWITSKGSKRYSCIYNKIVERILLMLYFYYSNVYMRDNCLINCSNEFFWHINAMFGRPGYFVCLVCN